MWILSCFQSQLSDLCRLDFYTSCGTDLVCPLYLGAPYQCYNDGEFALHAATQRLWKCVTFLQQVKSWQHSASFLKTRRLRYSFYLKEAGRVCMGLSSFILDVSFRNHFLILRILYVCITYFGHINPPSSSDFPQHSLPCLPPNFTLAFITHWVPRMPSVYACTWSCHWSTSHRSAVNQ